MISVKAYWKKLYEKIEGKSCSFIRFFFLPYAIFVIKIFKPKEVDSMIYFSFNKFFSLIRPAQIKDEILILLQFLKNKKPEILLEIGTGNGGTLFLFSCVVSEDAYLISIDLPGGKFGGGYPRWKIPLFKSFTSSKQKINLVRSDSHKRETLEKVKAILNSRKVDFLFIDGDHSYEGVKIDLEMFSPLIKREGLIAFHDIVPGPEENVGGVPQFWREIKNKYKTMEIVKDWNQGGYGIGMIMGG